MPGRQRHYRNAMSELQPTPNQSLPPAPLQSAEEPIAYKPISGWAIAGCAAGGLFAVLTLVSTIVALVQGAPMFFHVSTVGLAVAGVVLSLLGQRHIQNSEGTRAGAKLARIGLWLSIVSGLCYLSYYFVTGFAVTSQAGDFLMVKSDDDTGFFPRLRDGATDPVQLNSAFLLTLPGNQRSARADNEATMTSLYDITSKDGGMGNLSQFKYGLSSRYNGMVLPSIFFGRNAKDVKIEPGAVLDWKYEQKSYKVFQTYHLETKELKTDVTMIVFSTEAEAAGQGRKWYVALPMSALPRQPELTAWGQGLKVLRHQARGELETWIDKLNSGTADATLAGIDKTDWANTVRPELKGKRDLVHKLFADDTANRIVLFQHGQEPDIGKWEEVDGKIRFHHAFRFGLPKALGEPPTYMVDAIVVYETVRADVDVAAIDSTSKRVEWKLLQFKVINITSPQPKIGGPPG
jgi:hypothetical protein